MQVAWRERADQSRMFQVEARRAFPGPDFPLSAGSHFILKAQLVKTLTIVKLSTFQGKSYIYKQDPWPFKVLEDDRGVA